MTAGDARRWCATFLLCALATLCLPSAGSADTPTWTRWPFPTTDAAYVKAYDTKRGRLVAYSAEDDRLLTYDFSAAEGWSSFPLTGILPETKWGNARVYYDARADRLIFYAIAASEVWFFDLAAPAEWTRADVSGAVWPGSYGQPTEFDSVRYRLLMWTSRAELLEMPLQEPFAWRHVAVGGATRVLPKTNPAVAFDAIHQKLYVYGGGDPGWDYASYDKALYRLDMDANPPQWAVLHPSGEPPDASRYSPSMTLDENNSALVVVGEEVHKLPLEGELRWRRSPLPPRHPGPQHLPYLVVDRKTDRLYLCGLRSNLNQEIWAEPGGADTTWTLVAGPPYRRQGESTIFDPVGRRLIVFGGGSRFNQAELWSLTLDKPPRWQMLEAEGPAPPARADHSAIYDPACRRMLIYGGVGAAGEALSDIWALSLEGPPRWSQIETEGPGAGTRWRHACVLDPVADEMQVVCGVVINDYGYFQRTDGWSLSLGPSPRWRNIWSGNYRQMELASAVFDPVGRRTLIYGGLTVVFIPGHPDKYVHSFSGKFEELRPGDSLPRTIQVTGPSPPQRYEHAAVYDSRHRRMLIFGGQGPTLLNDLWAFDVAAATPAWTQLATNGPPPPSLSRAAAFDPLTATLWLYNPNRDGTLWSLALGDSLVHDAAGTVFGEHLKVSWTLGEGSFSGAQLYRRKNNGAWLPVTTLNRGPHDDVSYEDWQVEAGTRYDYRLGITLDDSEYTLGAISLTTAREWPFGEMRIASNPARGAATVSYRLSSAGPATLKLFDVRGRLVRSVRLEGASEAGNHVLRLGNLGELPSGQYVLQLTQGEAREIQRLTLLK